MNKSYLLCSVVSAALLAGCSAHVRGSASVRAPELVYVSPGVQVIADYREPIFYSDRYYWRYSGNVWYRSSNHTSGWVRYQAPVAVLRIERPSAYVYYRGAAKATTRREQRKDLRQDAQDAQREERKEATQEQKEERQEQKEDRQEQKEERQEQRNDHKDAKKDRR